MEARSFLVILMANSVILVVKLAFSPSIVPFLSLDITDDCIGSNSTLKTTRNYDCASAIVCTCEENLLLSEPEISETRLLCFLYQEFLSQSQVQYKYLSCSPQSCPSNCLLLLE
ncbi:uncharacterized protein LOC120082160 isoform X2 [Benincasa hispida]|uniref:uncharacterized protein LOC120082160 isoform X2 n=1 Tax=Benincasa hispida TaxID=102211 RepID=UPI0019021BA1|nr:uncharacterized protein LOC120082160 isoform X2 [Benincasa hispida]